MYKCSDLPLTIHHPLGLLRPERTWIRGLLPPSCKRLALGDTEPFPAPWLRISGPGLAPWFDVGPGHAPWLALEPGLAPGLPAGCAAHTAACLVAARTWRWASCHNVGIRQVVLAPYLHRVHRSVLKRPGDTEIRGFETRVPPPCVSAYESAMLPRLHVPASGGLPARSRGATSAVSLEFLESPTFACFPRTLVHRLWRPKLRSAHNGPHMRDVLRCIARRLRSSTWRLPPFRCLSGCIVAGHNVHRRAPPLHAQRGPFWPSHIPSMVVEGRPSP